LFFLLLLLLLLLETGDVLKYWQTPAQIATIVGTSNVASSSSALPTATPAAAATRVRRSCGRVRIVVGGKW
jgi:hypothetical protein